MSWGRKRDSELRQELQRCQSRIRLAQAALTEFREHFIPMAMAIPINEVAELMFYLERAETLLSSTGEGGGR